MFLQISQPLDQTMKGEKRDQVVFIDDMYRMKPISLHLPRGDHERPMEAWVIRWARRKRLSRRGHGGISPLETPWLERQVSRAPGLCLMIGL